MPDTWTQSAAPPSQSQLEQKVLKKLFALIGTEMRVGRTGVSKRSHARVGIIGTLITAHFGCTKMRCNPRKNSSEIFFRKFRENEKFFLRKNFSDLLIFRKIFLEKNFSRVSSHQAISPNFGQKCGALFDRNGKKWNFFQDAHFAWRVTEHFDQSLKTLTKMLCNSSGKCAPWKKFFNFFKKVKKVYTLFTFFKKWALIPWVSRSRLEAPGISVYF